MAGEPTDSTKDLTQGLKFDQEKVPLELISAEAIMQLGAVLQFGAKKYAPWNWSRGITYTRVLGAALRHIFAYLSGESKDPETGLSHIAHAMCCCMFVLHYEKYRKEFDNRSFEAYNRYDMMIKD